MRDRAEETLEALSVGSQFIVTDSGTPWPGNIQTGNEADQVKHIFYDGVNETFTQLDADAQRQGNLTIIVENVHGTADERFADDLAQKIVDRSGDGREFGFVTVTQ